MFVVDQNTLDIGSARQVARSATRFFSGLTFADRSGLALLPVGQGVAFTWAHATVRDALQRVVGTAAGRTTWEYGSLADARDIANSNTMALRNLGQRECGGSILAGGGGGGGGGGVSEPTPAAGPAPAPDPSGSSGGASGGTGTASTGSGGRTGGGRGGSSSSPFGGIGANSCMRNLQMQAESAWRTTQINSLTSVSAMRQTLAQLANVRGDKTVILISGGWPLDERDETSLISEVAAEALAARATIFTIYVRPLPFRPIDAASSRRRRAINISRRPA